MAATRNRLSANLPERVGAFLAARLGPDERLSVGLSGGCDSVVLLHLLSRLGYAGRLDAIHVHHGLSPNADAWAQFCADYCRRLDIPLAIRRVTVDLSSGLGLEAAARAARYAVFAETAGDCLLLAQHRGDQAETVLFNLLRGAGVTGAAGMPVERSFEGRRLLRPLLDISRAEIEAYANETGLLWVSDESNADTSLTRNFLRHEALVALDSRFPNAEASLAQAASNFGEAAGLLDDLADLDWRSVGAGEAARMAALKTLSLPRLKNLLRHRLRQLGWQVPVAKRLDEFARQLQVSGPDRHPELVLPGGKMCVAHRLLHWMPEKQQTVTKRLSAAIGLQLQSTDYSFHKQAMITGSIVAIVTPMHEDGSLDLNSLRKLVDFHVSEGTDAIVVVGTTGESPTVNVEEHCELIKLTVDHAAGRIPVIAGTGANSTAEAIELTEFARQAGADMALSVVPYYNKPTQEGLYRHFKAIAEAVELPVLLYNVPGRTVADMANDTILRLAEVPGIVGVKDATGNFDRACDLIARAPKGFALYSGDDMSCVSTIMMGFHGNISVTANVAPRLMHEMCVAAAAGDVARAREIQFSLLGLHRDLFCEANPIPVKWAVHKLGLMPNGIRLPLTPLSEANQARVLSAMRQAGVIA